MKLLSLYFRQYFYVIKKDFAIVEKKNSIRKKKL